MQHTTDTAALESSLHSEDTEDDFFSDKPLAVCPMRRDGAGSDEICEACQ